MAAEGGPGSVLVFFLRDFADPWICFRPPTLKAPVLNRSIFGVKPAQARSKDKCLKNPNQRLKMVFRQVVAYI